VTSRDAVPVRDAATVVLLRDGDTGPETWLLTRHTDMVFAAGMSVFPGGRIAAADADLPFGGALDDVARQLDCDVAAARTLVGAAVRETFEETGLLLTVPTADLAGARAEVEAGRASFGDLLREHGLAVDAAAVRPWSRWVTPAGEVRRYDARFFVCAVAPEAGLRDVTTESSEADWVPVAVALDQARRGERGLMPPTLVTLGEIGRYKTVAEVLAAAAGRTLEPTRPQLAIASDGSVSVSLPDGTVLPIPRSLLPR
jgi:8-oxo-dGTP pyrophosphatase MutT (NUDIX family)